MRGITVPILAVLLLPLVGCGGGGGGGGGGSASPAAPALSIGSVTVSGTTDTICTVTVGGQPDGDGSADTAWTRTLNLDGGGLPAYTPGTAYDEMISISAEDTEMRTTGLDIEISISP